MSRPVVHRRRRLGGSAIEFALLMPLFLGVLAGIIEYGWYEQRQALLTSAVRRAARTGATAGEYESPVENAKAKLTEGLVDHGFTASDVVVEVRGSAPDAVVYVESQVKYDALLGLVPVPPKNAAAVGMRLEVQNR